MKDSFEIVVMSCGQAAVQLVGALPHTPKGGGFDPGWGVNGRQPIDVSFSQQCLSPPPPPNQ